MRPTRSFRFHQAFPLTRLFAQIFLLWAFVCSAVDGASASDRPAIGPTGVIVQSKFGGQIFGFDIDQASNEGILCEAQTLDNGHTLAAVETFNQTTGALIRVLRKTQRNDDFLSLGVVGSSVGLVEREHEVSFLNVVRSYLTVNPLTANKFNGTWTPPLGTDHMLSNVSRNQSVPNIAVYAQDTNSTFRPFIFTSNVAANTFGPVITLTDEDFVNTLPALAYNSATNQAVLGAPKLGNPFVPGRIATVDLTTGTFNKFTSVGDGDVNGLAVDPESGTVCTTTEIDFSVEFYDLATQTGFKEILAGAPNQFYSGADVQFDPVNKLFLVAQPNSSTTFSGSSIHVYDVDGNLIESINGLSFSNAGNVVPAHIALNPSKRLGFVDGPDAGVSQIQSFTY
jgi:hypothetical protein